MMVLREKLVKITTAIMVATPFVLPSSAAAGGHLENPS